MAKYQPYMQDEDEDSGPGLGTLGALAAAAALASPVGKPVRRLVGEYAGKADDYLGTPLKGLRSTFGSEVVDPAKLAAARAANAMTGGAGELASRSYARAMQGAPGASDQFGWKELGQNLGQTWAGTKAGATALKDFLGSTTDAIPVAYRKNKDAGTIMRNKWAGKNRGTPDQEKAFEAFMKTPEAELFGEDIGTVKRLFIDDPKLETPMQAALKFLQISAAKNLGA